MGFRRGDRCWQCNEPLAMNDTHCLSCGAWPKPNASTLHGRPRRGGFLDWLIDNAVWIVAAVALVVGVVVTIKEFAEPRDRRAGAADEASRGSIPTRLAPVFDPTKSWPLSRVPDASLPVKVVEIVSGDTFVVEMSGERSAVYLVGAIAPEIGEPRWPGACYAEESRAHLEAVLEPGTTLYVQQEAAEAVGNGPMRAYLWFADRGRRVAYLINELIVADGDAVADLPVTDQEIGARLAIAQNQAESSGVGLWGVCSPPVATPS